MEQNNLDQVYLRILYNNIENSNMKVTIAWQNMPLLKMTGQASQEIAIVIQQIYIF